MAANEVFDIFTWSVTSKCIYIYISIQDGLSVNLNSTTPLEINKRGLRSKQLSDKVLANMFKTVGSIPRTRRKEGS